MNHTKKASAGIFDRNENHSRLDSRASSTVFSKQSSRVSSRASNSSHVSSASTIRNSGRLKFLDYSYCMIHEYDFLRQILLKYRFSSLNSLLIFICFDELQPFAASLSNTQTIMKISSIISLFVC